MSRIAWAGERGLSAISIHLPDEDALNEADVRLIRECRPTSLLAIRYPWDTD